MKVYSCAKFFVYNLCMLTLGLLYAWSVFSTPLNQLFPDWTAAQLSLCFSLTLCFYCIGGFVGGSMMKKTGNRIVLACSAAMLFIGFLGASFLNTDRSTASLYQLYFFYGIFCGCGVGMSNICIIDEAGRLSATRTGTLTGIVQMSFGLGGLVFGIAAKKLIAIWGLSWAFRTLAVIAALVMLLGACFSGKGKSTAEGVSNQAEESVGMAPAQMLYTPSFWLFMVWNISLAAAGLMIINSAVQIAASLMLPTIVGLMVSFCNSAGRLGFGNIYDRYPLVPSMYIPPILMGASSLFLFLATKIAVGAVGAIGLLIAGIAYGSCPITTALFIRKTFGTQHFPKNMGLSQFSLIPASLLGPYFSGLLQGYDKAQMTISDPQSKMFASTFIAVACFSLLTILVNSALLRCTIKNNSSKTE